MTWAITWLDEAKKDVRRLDRKTQERVLAAVERYARTEHGDVRRYIEGIDGELALRVGEWRVFLVRDCVAGVLRVRGVRARGRAYR